MKRIIVLLSLAVLCAAAVFAVPYVKTAQEKARRQEAYAQMLANSKPLVLDAATQAILTNADRVEAFRLADFHEEEYRSAEEEAALDGPHVQVLDDYTVLRTGLPQGREFAAALRAAISQIRSPTGKDGLMSMVPSCFDPGVGFRVWHGKAHVDLCVCFYCTGIQIVTTDAHGKQLPQVMTMLGASRPAFLALSKQVFPQDKQLARLE